MSGSRWVITSLWLSVSWRSFLYSSSVYSCHLLLLLGPYHICPWNVPLVSLIFLKRSLVFPILLFSSTSLHWLLKKAFLSLFAILWNSAFKCVYLSFSFFAFSVLFFSRLFVRPPQTTILPFCISFSWGWSWSLLPVQCHEPPSIVLQAVCLLDLTSWICLSHLLYNRGIWFRSYLNGLVVFPTFFNLSLNLAISSSWSEPQSAPGLVFAEWIELLHLWLQRI